MMGVMGVVVYVAREEKYKEKNKKMTLLLIGQ